MINTHEKKTYQNNLVLQNVLKIDENGKQLFDGNNIV